MISWETMIDGTSFGIIAGYLRDPRSPIQYILHVKDRSKLSQVARRLELEFSSGTSPAQPLSPGLLALVQNGAIKVSSREAVVGIAPSAVIDVTQVRRTAYTEVIYLPPFYLAHTPGLFEGKVIDNKLPAKDQHLRAVTQDLEPALRRDIVLHHVRNR